MQPSSSVIFVGTCGSSLLWLVIVGDGSAAAPIRRCWRITAIFCFDFVADLGSGLGRRSHRYVGRIRLLGDVLAVGTWIFARKLADGARWLNQPMQALISRQQEQRDGKKICKWRAHQGPNAKNRNRCR